MGRFVIAAYTPKPGKVEALMSAVRKHMDVLRAEGLVTDRPAYVMRAGDGTVIEVFEWRSTEAIKKAHATPAVHALWAEFEQACDYLAPGDLPECRQLFSEFESITP